MTNNYVKRPSISWLLRRMLLLCVSAPTLAQFSPCQVCGKGFTLNTTASTSILNPFTGVNTTCALIAQEGIQGGYTLLECAAIQFTVKVGCLCQAAAGSIPTASPASAANRTTTAPKLVNATFTSTVPITTTHIPTAAQNFSTVAPTMHITTPTALTTASPNASAARATAAPSLASTHPSRSPAALGPTVNALPTQSTVLPTARATGSNVTKVFGRVRIELKSVVGAMPNTTQRAYALQAQAYFSDKLAQQVPPITNVVSTLESQTIASSRRLQSNNNPLKALLTVLQVTGNRNTSDHTHNTSDQNSSEISGVLQTIVNNNSDLVTYLRNATPAINQIYFKQVSSVVASQAGPAPGSPTVAPGAAPTTGAVANAASGLNKGAIAGIAVGGILLVAAVIAVICSTQSNGSHDDSPYKETEVTSAEVAPERSSQDQKNVATAQAITPVIDSDSESEDEERENEEDAYSANDSNNNDSDGAVSDGAVDEGVSAETAEDISSGSIPTRDVVAPAGKLGIVIDTTLEGPVVHKVNPGSPLEGILSPGDLIVAIDDVDTRAMSASSITSLMVKTCNQKRVLKVIAGGGS
jgi:hypothetical protein